MEIKYLILPFLVIFLSSCTLLGFNEKEADNNNDVPTLVEQVRAPEPVFGSIKPSDRELYTDFQVRIACGEEHEDLLDEYNITIKRLVEIGQTINNETLVSAILEGMLHQCPDKIEFTEPSIGTIE